MARFKSHHRKLEYNRQRAIDNMHLVHLSAEQSRVLHRGGKDKHVLISSLTKWLKQRQFVGEYFFSVDDVRSASEKCVIYAFYFTNPNTAMHFKLFWG